MFLNLIPRLVPLLAQLPESDHFEMILDIPLMLWLTGQLLMVIAPFLLLTIAFIFIRDIIERVIKKPKPKDDPTIVHIHHYHHDKGGKPKP